MSVVRTRKSLSQRRSGECALERDRDILWWTTYTSHAEEFMDLAGCINQRRKEREI
jgi:hypothetical protein